MFTVINYLPSKQAVLGSNPSAITSLKKPRLFWRGSLFYGKIELVRNLAIKQSTGATARGFLFALLIGLGKPQGNPSAITLTRKSIVGAMYFLFLVGV